MYDHLQWTEGETTFQLQMTTLHLLSNAISGPLDGNGVRSSIADCTHQCRSRTLNVYKVNITGVTHFAGKKGLRVE